MLIAIWNWNVLSFSLNMRAEDPTVKLERPSSLRLPQVEQTSHETSTPQGDDTRSSVGLQSTLSPHGVRFIFLHKLINMQIVLYFIYRTHRSRVSLPLLGLCTSFIKWVYIKLNSNLKHVCFCYFREVVCCTDVTDIASTVTIAFKVRNEFGFKTYKITVRLKKTV